MTYTGVSQALDWAARLRRFRRLMMITVDAGQRGVATLTTSNLSRGGLAAIGDHTLAPGDRARIYVPAVSVHLANHLDAAHAIAINNGQVWYRHGHIDT